MSLLEQARERENVPDTHALRIDSYRAETGLTALRLAWAEQPETSDEVVDNGEQMSLFVSGDIAPDLEDALIDVGDGASQLVIRYPENNAST